MLCVVVVGMSDDQKVAKGLRCVLFVGCCLSFDDCCVLLFVVRCFLFVVCCVVFDVRCLFV